MSTQRKPDEQMTIEAFLAYTAERPDGRTAGRQALGAGRGDCNQERAAD